MTAAGLAERARAGTAVRAADQVGIPFWAPLLEMNAAHVWRSLTPEQQQKAHQAVAAAYEAFRDGGHYVLKSHMRIISGTRSDAAARALAG